MTQTIHKETLREFGQRNMTVYGLELNLRRSVPDIFDGCKPVQKRILYALSQLDKRYVKASRVVGDTLGKYHPHGDLAISDALVTLVNSSTPPIKGSGNWGSLTDNAAAPRYIECKLSNYGLSFFDPNYIHKEVTDFVPNYDNTEIEPVTLPAKLPNVLLQDVFGIGYGITTEIPAFTSDSMIAVLKRVLSGEKLEAKDYAKALKLASGFHEMIMKTEENKKGWLQMFTSPKGKLRFESPLDIDRDRKTIQISKWGPEVDGKFILAFVDKIRSMPECRRCYNSKGTTTYTIECKTEYNYAQFDKFVEKVKVATRNSKAYKLNVTKRTAQVIDGKTHFHVDFLALSVPDMLKEWIRLRIELETKSLQFQIRKQDKAIAYSELLIYAADHVDKGAAALKSSDPKASLMKSMKLTDEQAQTLLNLRFVQWSKLDQASIKETLKEQTAHHKLLNRWLKNPKAKLLLDMDEMVNVLAADAKIEEVKKKQKLTVVS
jgi:topoisomerase IV subunit A